MPNLVTVIIPTFNRSDLLGRTLDSVLAQTYDFWECLVIDDGTNDHTEEMMNFYCDKDPRIKFYKRPATRKKGASSCRNYAFELSKGDYIQYLDSDDMISTDKLEKQVNILLENKSCSIVTCRWGRFWNSREDAILFEGLEVYNDFESTYDFLDALSRSKGYFPLNVYLIRRELISRAGIWNEYLNLNDDGEFMMRVIGISGPILFEKEATAYYRWPVNNNLSLYSKKSNVIDAINSWKLIEAFLLLRYKGEKISYVENAKNGIYLNLKRSFPDLIKKNTFFFKFQIKQDNKYKEYYRKIIKLLSRKINLK